MQFEFLIKTKDGATSYVVCEAPDVVQAIDGLDELFSGCAVIFGAELSQNNGELSTSMKSLLDSVVSKAATAH